MRKTEVFCREDSLEDVGLEIVQSPVRVQERPTAQQKFQPVAHLARAQVVAKEL